MNNSISSIDYLKNNGLLIRGTTIKREEMEKALKVKYKPYDMDFVGAKLDLMTTLEPLGYFCTFGKCGEGEMRILPLETMNREGPKRLRLAFKKIKRTADSMINAVLVDADEKTKLKHQNATYMLLAGAHAMKGVLNGI